MTSHDLTSDESTSNQPHIECFRLEFPIRAVEHPAIDELHVDSHEQLAVIHFSDTVDTKTARDYAKQVLAPATAGGIVVVGDVSDFIVRSNDPTIVEVALRVDR